METDVLTTPIPPPLAPVMEQTNAGLVERGKCAVHGCEEIRHPADCTGYCRKHKEERGLRGHATSDMSDKFCECGCGQLLTKAAVGANRRYCKGHSPTAQAKAAAPAPVVQPEAPAPEPSRPERTVSPRKETPDRMYAQMLKTMRKEIAEGEREIERLETLRDRITRLKETEAALAQLVERK